MNWDLVLLPAAITVVFTRGSIFAFLRTRGPRLWRDLVSCALCSGVWLGGGWFWMASVGRFTWDTILWAWALGNGCLTGVLALVVSMGLDWLESASEANAALKDVRSAATIRPPPKDWA